MPYLLLIGLAVVLVVALFFILVVMAGLRRRSAEAAASWRRDEPVPEWAGFFTPRQYAVFMRRVEAYFAASGEPFHMRGGSVIAGERGEFGLGNLAQVCNQTEEDQWDQVIAAHFAILRNSEQEQKDVEDEIADFERIRDRLAVRINGRSFISADLIVCREDLPGTVSYLVLDLPNTVRTVHPDEIKPWGRSLDELFAAGLENVWKTCKPGVEQVDLADGLRCTALCGDSFFVASHALLIERMPELIGPGGALVAIPHRHCMICYPMHTLETIGAVHVLAQVAQRMEKEGPGSISPRLYWYHQGKYRDIPCEQKPDEFVVRPPQEFVDVLEELPAAPDRPDTSAT